MKIAYIGLGKMGKNMVELLLEQGIEVVAYNRHPEAVKEVAEKGAIPAFTYKEIFDHLDDDQRIIWLMVPHSAVSHVIDEIKPFLKKEDIVIDGGNSLYENSITYAKDLEQKGVHFLDIGVSGGPWGARHGSCLLVGGPKKVYDIVLPLIQAAAAPDSYKYLGETGAGHFAKMVHNGIEYVEMQLIAEIYSIVKKFMNNHEISKLFNKWNKGHNSSYLLGISHQIFQKKEGNKYLIDLISDKAENKGTGIWSSIAALKYGEPNSMVSSAVNSRFISKMKSERIFLSENKPSLKKTTKIDLEVINKSYEFARLINHIQSFNLIKKASKINGWEYNPSEISRVWTQGCIIRSELMENLFLIFKTSKDLLKNKNILEKLHELEQCTSNLISHGLENKIPLDAFSNSYNYWLSICSDTSPANLIQAQRDFFGGHGYSRIDKGLYKTFNSNWQKK